MCKTEFLTSVPALCLYAALAAAVFLWGRSKRKKPEPAEWAPAKNETWIFCGNGDACFSAKVIMEQLDKKCSKVIHRYYIGRIPDGGVSISRPNAVCGDIRLSNAEEAAYTVSRLHAFIGCGENGFYIRENESGTCNGTYLDDGTQVRQTAITNGMIIFLGTQPLHFHIPSEKRYPPHGYLY